MVTLTENPTRSLPARPLWAPTAQRPPGPHTCSTRLAVLRVCFWDWRCGESPFMKGPQPGYVRLGGPPTPDKVKHFRGPCADNCKPLAPCCCVSADGEAIFGCVLTDREYLLPACLHMALCPQLGCDPKGGVSNLPDDTGKTCILFSCLTLFLICRQEEFGDGSFW